ncbi:glycoside hydrolase family 15 protein [Curtobacterium ammoniigenes]|uniref:glycoside hydrolase family 15 protein n=1 Tax=Curtobacterium ammoniigenes TaxID=395387 RepID=UPI0009F926B4|nr:glycoside hydrolase family 15 protein [Curtobacterium ammoniigenes]
MQTYPNEAERSADGDVESRVDGYAPIRSYAAIGDGRTIGLIARDGRVDWLPVPSLDAPPVFAAILDSEHGGHIALRPTGPASVERHYHPGTNVLVTTWTTDTGSCTVTDAMITGVAGRLPWLEFGRCVQGVDGEVELEWAVEPGTMLGTATPVRHDTGNGPVVAIDGVTIAIVERGFEPVHEDGPRFSGRFLTQAGSQHILTIVGTRDEPVYRPDPGDSMRGIDRTLQNWEDWSREFSYTGPWAEAVQRSALALKLLIYAPTGAIAAAGTTSLPENEHGGKNWDYRFAWVRDLSFTVRSLYWFGLREEPHAAVSWVLRTIAEHGDGMPIFYTLEGEKADGVHHRDVPGWRGIGPVVEGNAASHQLQLGVYGDVFEVMRGYVANGNVLDRHTADVLEGLADDACKRWPEKDSGLWELSEQQHYVSSKIGCWQALDAAIELHDKGQLHGDREGWVRNRELIEEWVSEHGWSEERQSYVMYAGSDKLDTSMLLHSAAFDRGARMNATIDAILKELSVGPLVYRYSGMAAEESPFVACSFWLASAMASVGRIDEAVALMNAMIDQANDVGLYSEMISADTGAFMGNVPQGLSHLALIHAAIHIADEAEEARHKEADATSDGQKDGEKITA